MDSFLWLIFSWVVVALISYFIIGTFWGSGSDGVTGAPILITSSSRRSTLADWSSEWFNEVVVWLWTSKRFSPSIIQLLVKALNDAAKKHAKLNQCEIHFTADYASEISDQRNVPIFEKIKAQQGSARTDHLVCTSYEKGNLADIQSYSFDYGVIIELTVLTTKVSAERFGVKVVASKQLPDGNVVVVSSSTVLITDIFGEVETRLAHIADELFVMSCFVGRPEMCIDVQDNNPSSYSTPQMPKIDSLTLEELVRKCVVSAVLNFSLSEFLFSTSDSARNSMARLSSEIRNLSFLNEHYPPPPSQQQLNRYVEEANLPPNVLEIRVLGAQNLGIQQEIDEPPQKFVTSKAVSKHMNNCNPNWEETFEFNLTATSDKLLFEVYDEQKIGKANTQEVFRQQGGNLHAASSNRFMGLAIVGLSELKRRSHSPMHQLQLQSKPYGNGEAAANVTGSLLVEVRFLHIPIHSNSLPRQPNDLVTNTMRQQQPKFPITGFDDHSSKKGSLSRFQPSYIYNLDDHSQNPSPSPPKTSLLTHQSQTGNKYSTKLADNHPYQQEQEPVLLDYERAQQQNYEYNSTANPYDRQGSPSTPSQHSLLIHQVNQNSQQSSAVGHSTEIISAPYINREQQQYSLERAAQKPRMINERPNVTRSMDQFSVPTIFTYSPQGAAMNDQINVTTSRSKILESSPPPIPPHQPPSALEETARKAREREPKTQPSKRREHSFFEGIRQRLSRGSFRAGRKRAKSLDEQNLELEEAVSVPPSRDNSSTRDQSQVRSNPAQYPETSTIDSQPFDRAWKNNAPSNGSSQLILELDNSNSGGENANGKRYYLIPPEIMNEPAATRLLRNGKKLHVHNSHTFVAVKPRGRVMCNFCGRSITGNFTKQAYQCRDCRKVSHKSCHQRSSSPCHHSNLSNLEIIEDVDWVDFLRQYQLEEYISINGL